MIIIKVGGGRDINWNYVCQDIASLVKKEKVVVVHGANYRRDKVARKLGHPTKNIISPSGVASVYTDKKALEIFLMVYAGLVNKQIVAKLQKLGVSAVGLSGVDGRLWEAKRKANTLVKEKGKTKLLRNNFVGRVEKVNTNFLNILLNNGYVPVICPPAISFDSEIVNVDNDLAVAVLARELNVKKIVNLFEAPGLLMDSSDERTKVERIEKEKVDDYLNLVNGRMKKKVMGAKYAIDAGIESIYWGYGRVKNPIKKALAGRGTVIQ